MLISVKGKGFRAESWNKSLDLLMFASRLSKEKEEGKQDGQWDDLQCFAL